MKRILPLALALLLALGLTACTPDFVGNYISNESQLVTEYKVLNKTMTQKLRLTAGDTLLLEVNTQQGQVDLCLQKDGEPPLFDESGALSLTTEFQVDSDGTYLVTLTGRQAKGSVSILKDGASTEPPSIEPLEDVEPIAPIELT